MIDEGPDVKIDAEYMRKQKERKRFYITFVRICSLAGFARRISRVSTVYKKEISQSARFNKVISRMTTYAGQPMTIATAPRIESPFPYPRALYMDGANRGKPNPAQDRRNVTAARANKINQTSVDPQEECGKSKV